MCGKLATANDCERHDYVGNRKCAKRCEREADCKSKKKQCECDGVCGRSCVNLNLRCLPVPSPIANGKVDILPFNRFGAVARYTCQEGYTLVGLPARVCQGDETWNGDEPRCELNHKFLADKTHLCSSPPLVHHAHHTGSQQEGSSYELGSFLRYKCNSGYIPRKNSVDRAWCVGGGIWVGPNMTCVTRAVCCTTPTVYPPGATAAAGCEPPPPIANGSVVTLSGGVGSEAEYRCDPGFFLIGESTRHCLKDGKWDGREPKCAKGLKVVEAKFAKGLKVVEAKFAKGLKVVEAKFAKGLKVVEAKFANNLKVVEAKIAKGLKVVEAKFAKV
ncbi:hypothetical protein ACOMHN_029273 [Nucella lapillus]